MPDQEPAYFNLGISSDQNQTTKNYLSLFPEEIIASILDAFIINKPMIGTVGGDGFWVHQQGENLLIALFDCSGQGHLASMTTRIYIQLLQKIIKEEGIDDPGTILRYLHHRIAAKFRGKTNLKIESSADFGVIKINLQIRKIEYSGANISLLHMEDGQLAEIAAIPLPIGSLFDEHHPYETTFIPLKEGVISNFYLATDGFQNLQGGSKHSKLGIKNIQSLLKQIHAKPMMEQKEAITTHIKEWQGSNEQPDDVLILGFSL